MNGSSPYSAVSDPDPRFLSIEVQLASLRDLLVSQRTVKDYYTTSEVAKILTHLRQHKTASPGAARA